MTLGVYAIKTLAEFKGISPNEEVLWQLLGEDFPTVEDLCIYYYAPTSTEVSDDVEVIRPDSVGPSSPGRWLRCDLHYMQPDWNAISGARFIQNKPTIPAGQVKADWTAGSGVAEILNKPSIPTVNPVAVAGPAVRTLALATAYQAADNTAPAVITVNLSSQSSVSLGGAVNNEGEVVIGATNAVAGGTGSKIGDYKNNLGGTLILGLNLSHTQGQSFSFALPAGWYFAIRQTVGSGLTIISAFDQKLSN